MTFNKAILDTTAADTSDRIDVLITEVNELKHLLNMMRSIQDEDIIREVDGRPTRITIEKKDTATREAFTPTRLDTVYDMNVPLAQTKIIVSV